MRWRIAWTKIGEGRLAAAFHAELARGELSLEDTRVFQKQLREVLAATGGSARFDLRE